MIPTTSREGLIAPPDDEPAEVLTFQDMLSQFPVVNICAPMVRYGKLSFRELVSRYETHVTYSPMILAQEFSRSAIARDTEFSTSTTERGTFLMVEGTSKAPIFDLEASKEPRAPPTKRARKVRGSFIVQFAANDGQQLAEAAELVKPYCDGIDINCGCPQSWAYKTGVGCALLRQPELVRDLVRSTKQRLGWSFPVSVKIRIDPSLSNTDTLVRTAIAAGADVITVHGRTRHQSSSGYPVNLDGIAFAVSCAKGEVPMVANGDVFSLDDAVETRRRTGVSGVMSARGLLANPALFAGYNKTPLPVIEEFANLATSTGLIYQLFHRHVSYMLESHLNRKSRIYLNSLASHGSLCDFLQEDFGLFGGPSGTTGLERSLAAL
ncbi:tRNA-dihydrouridine synthase 4 [Pseudohyphozyma bogoriensis]|nr:tRNA-dihydrouridine synthase 4 [Pseudohyphozyma bogoriensis]